MRSLVAVASAAAVLLVGCNAPTMQDRMKEVSTFVQQTISAAELENWATNTLTTVSTNGEVTIMSDYIVVPISTNEVPIKIRHLMLDSGDVAAWVSQKSNESAILFTYGGGFGHWGYAVGASKSAGEFGRLRTYWTNNIWFWHE